MLLRIIIAVAWSTAFAVTREANISRDAAL